MFEGISLFDSLTEKEKKNLALFCQERVLEDGEILFQEDNEAVAMYFLKNGLLKVYKTNLDGETVLGYIKPGDVVGEMPFFESDDFHKLRSASVKALEKSVVVVILFVSVKELGDIHPDVYTKIIAIIKERREQNLKNQK
ncbi:MAG: cyclic nucleotide-binding domain-containing protein [Candidatus Gracilibacteria bacterium]|nr:cyclic nucleotide-binding domain-containing protein [Candidatus Gracilibacteria bacterium]MDD3120539.1 cyclic nucleotide-binding domain-containing protein [Candidatus Gracilibacteria bacterium]